MAWPASGKLEIRSLASQKPHTVRMVDGGDLLKWKSTPNALVIELPKTQRGDHAFGVRLEGLG
jgi:hypothetical protein